MAVVEYEVKESIHKKVPTDKETVFGGKYMEHKEVGHKWVKVKVVLDDEVKEEYDKQEKRGYARNFKVVGNWRNLKTKSSKKSKMFGIKLPEVKF